jgi:hypothetical protein
VQAFIGLYGQQMHQFQYLMVGAALCLFYLLLLSILEFIGFSWAYLIAAAASTALITWYCRFFLGGGARTLMIGAGLAGVYTFLYITLRQQDYALLMGAIALCARNRNVRDAQSRLVRARCGLSLTRGIGPTQIDTSDAVLYHAAFIHPNRYPEV